MKVLIIFFLIIFCTLHSNQNSGTIQSHDGVEIYFQKKGNGNLTLVFIHGWSPNSECWKDQVEYFSDEYGVITLDLPGFGKSGVQREQRTINNYGKDIVTLIEKLNLDNVILIGHSMGGLVALSAAANESDNIKGLVLVDIVSDIENHRSEAWIEDLIDSWKLKIKKGNLKDLNDFFLEPELAQRYSEMLPEEIPDFWWDILRYAFAWMNDEMKSSLMQVNKPIILINSDAVETDVLSIEKYASDFYVNIMNGTSHYLFWDNPKEFNNILLNAIKVRIE